MVLQPIDYQRRLDLSPFSAFQVGKCHKTKNKPSERIALGKMFTKQADNMLYAEVQASVVPTVISCHIATASSLSCRAKYFFRLDATVLSGGANQQAVTLRTCGAAIEVADALLVGSERQAERLLSFSRR